MTSKSESVKAANPTPDPVQDYERQMNTPVTGVFKNLETPGHPLVIPHRATKGPIKSYRLNDGETTTIPFSLAHHLNEACFEPAHENADGHDVVVRGRQRYLFESVDYMTIRAANPRKVV